MNRLEIKRLVVTGLLIALGILLPIAFHAFGIAASAFSPMHIPVLICGLLCGWKYGGAAGIATVFLSSLFTGMPPLFPVAVYMMLELAAYGVIGGLLIDKLHPVAALAGAMIGGRIVLGIAQFVMFGILGLAGRSFAFGAFMTSAFVTAWPGIVLHIIAVPAVIYALRQAKLYPLENRA